MGPTTRVLNKELVLKKDGLEGQLFVCTRTEVQSHNLYHALDNQTYRYNWVYLDIGFSYAYDFHSPGEFFSRNVASYRTNYTFFDIEAVNAYFECLGAITYQVQLLLSNVNSLNMTLSSTVQERTIEKYAESGDHSRARHS